MDLIVFGATALGAIAAVGVVLALRMVFAPPRDEVIDRVQRVTTTRAPAEPQASTDKTFSVFGFILSVLSRVNRPTDGEEVSKLRQSLIHAGFRSERSVEIYYGSKILLAVVLGGGLLIGGSLQTEPLPNLQWLAIIAAAIGFYLPSVWLRGRKNQRQIAIQRSLPDALDLLITCVEAGLGIEAALNRITAEIGLAAPILALEFRQTTMEVQAGVTRVDAFRRLAERTGVEELRTLSAMLIQTEMFGTSIARALRVHSQGMRTRRTHRAEERGAAAAVKMMLPLIFCILPALFAVVIGPAIVRVATTLFPAMGGG